MFPTKKTALQFQTSSKFSPIKLKATLPTPYKVYEIHHQERNKRPWMCNITLFLGQTKKQIMDKSIVFNSDSKVKLTRLSHQERVVYPLHFSI
jgi:hypothetical protein